MDRAKPSNAACVERSRPHRQLPCHLPLCGSPTRRHRSEICPVLGPLGSMFWVAQSAGYEIHFVLGVVGHSTDAVTGQRRRHMLLEAPGDHTSFDPTARRPVGSDLLRVSAAL